MTTKYVVYGGEYTDATWGQVKPGTVERYGPFDTYDEAKRVWQERIWWKVDNCLHRLSIVEERPASYVYLLSTYDEYGAEDVKATRQRDHLPELLESYRSEWRREWQKRPGYCEKRLDELFREAHDGLLRLLETPDEEMVGTRNGHDLTDGWGGFQLHVVPLDEGNR